MSRRFVLVLLYAILLVASLLSTRARRHHAQPGPGQLVHVLPDQSEIAYTWMPDPDADAPLHLVLGHSEDLPASPVLQIDLPGQGRSSRIQPEASPEYHARQVWQLLESIAPGQSVHLHARGSASAAAIRLAEQHPDAVLKLTLQHPSGLRRDEGLGSPLLNRVLLAGRVSITWLLERGVPHFGRLDHTPFSHSAAVQAMAVDPQRNRVRLAGLNIPVVLEPTAAHSPAAISPDEPTGPPQPLTGRRMWWVVLALVFMMSVTEDLTCIGAGLLVWKGVMGFAPAVFGCFVGLMLGDMGLYLIGALFGPVALGMPPFRWFISAAAVERQKRRFKHNMFGLIASSRFLPGARVPCYVAAGLLRTGLFRFAFYLSIAALAWVPILVGLSALLGATFLEWFEAHKNLALLGVFGLIITLWLLIHKGLPLFTWKGRRLAYSAWQRWRRWEFWPRWAFYPPIFLHILGLMIKHRSVSLPLITNPGMPHSGAVLDPKSEIYRGLGPSPALPAWTELPPGLPADEALARLAPLDYPLVIKPDIGYRGQNIHFVENPEEARTALAAFTSHAIAQEKVDGPEFGVFYIREPGASSGRIPSITRKLIPHLTGDGNATLEHLILADERAVCMAPHFLHAFAPRLDDVPADGERIPLADIGTHSRGAIFLDATDLVTPELIAAMDAISLPYQGFHFGRFDLRAPSEAHLQRGEGLKILELNGITAESTHIYDPRHSLRYGRQTIRRQWSIAFDIAAANRHLGHKPPGCIAFFGLLFEFLRADEASD